MSSLELTVAVGIVVLGCASLARRLGIAAPVLLLIAGILLGFVPALRTVHLPPEAVLLLFLPVLLYWESFTSSVREIRSNLRVIALMSTILVALTAAGVAGAAHALGLPSGPAWVLGAAVAPTDATAVAVLGAILPRRIATTLKAESLVNDGTALVIYTLAVGVTIGAEHLSAAHLGGMFALSYAGGVAIGAAVTFVSVRVRSRLTDAFQHNLLALLTPLAAYLIAEAVEVSGVLAVVVSGLWVSRVSPRLFPAYARQYVRTVMGFLTSLANAALFVLVGVEAQSAVRGLSSAGLARGLLLVLAVSAVIVAVRFGWLFTSPYAIRVLDRRPQQRARRLPARPRVVMSAAGFRGAVSLAAALAVPHTLTSGAAFPNRDLIIFVTAGVIAVTLLVQAPLLPRIVGWAHLPEDNRPTEERHRAQITAVEEALAALPGLATAHDADPELTDRLRAEYERRLRVLRSDDPDTSNWGAADWDENYARLRRALIENKHATVVRMRDEGEIDDEVLLDLQEGLDAEAVHLTRHT
ncbi:Na+/H+ antiporter [Paractinoplanes ferrugineus]|uniref:Na(+)/H(+) exchanger n=1 Tax=Paractinoplanes ferrugineus TaxID=113564 RepID=A0A919M8F7_9ACTN|nr:Na+/H+ antiporter [Actinoplanes ferrugineus]GIE10426.1 putative Na(+)/H(+) exchanger [Actinoplanes ferrugineus]